MCTQSTTVVCVCFAYCHLYLLVLRLRSSHHLPHLKGDCIMVCAPSNDCSNCSTSIHACIKGCEVNRPLHSRTKRHWLSPGLHSLWIFPRVDKTICTADTSDGKLRPRTHMLSLFRLVSLHFSCQFSARY